MKTTRPELDVAEEARWRELMGLVWSLDPAQVEERGYTPDGWSVKDLIAHIGAWQAEAARVLEQLRSGTYAHRRFDVDEMNRRFYRSNRDLPLSVVKAECTASRSRMLSTWNRLEEITPEAEEWFRESGPEHYAEHLPRLTEWVAELRGR